jgi:hypothetical protein
MYVCMYVLVWIVPEYEAVEQKGYGKNVPVAGVFKVWFWADTV